MAAMFAVTFENGSYVYVHSADARSNKAKDIRASYVKARKKAEARVARLGGGKSRCTDIRCVG